ncbi:DUF4434 domain-containing protein [Candidatus Sumerlaeota bacterium]|nr:DUF4434 domain-containing protein [Candidatus Sumerlaeota bacterium]
MAKGMIKPIKGSWFEFQHHWGVEGKYWDKECSDFTEHQWEKKIEEVAEIGFDHLVLLDVACNGKAYYDTSLFPKFPFGCEDPLEICLKTADRLGIRFFIGVGFFITTNISWEGINSPEETRKTLQFMNEIAERYGRHPSFYGWYLPHEAKIDGHYEEEYVKYVQNCNREGRKLLPNGKMLIAPFGTRLAIPDDKYVKQLERLGVDFIAYQDEVGVRKSRVEELPAFYEGLKKAHERAGCAEIWADVEIFDFEGAVYQSALIPAPFERVKRQLEAASPYVEKILVYQYQGMMNKPGSAAFAGHPESTQLYRDYEKFKV